LGLNRERVFDFRGAGERVAARCGWSKARMDDFIENKTFGHLEKPLALGADG
jgi:hypothetical protein